MNGLAALAIFVGTAIHDLAGAVNPHWRRASCKDHGQELLLARMSGSMAIRSGAGGVRQPSTRPLRTGVARPQASEGAAGGHLVHIQDNACHNVAARGKLQANGPAASVPPHGYNQCITSLWLPQVINGGLAQAS